MTIIIGLVTLREMKPAFENLSGQMILIPEGSIAMRDDRTGREWQVKISPFLLQSFPVTQALYTKVTGTSPSALACANCPVDNVSWLNAAGFCNQLSRAFGFSDFYEIVDEDIGAITIPNSNGFRLPTEAEWEFACRAGTQGARYAELNDIAWYSGNSSGRVQPVGLKQPNAWGLYDMLGNVWEWCSDQYAPQKYGAYRIFRGGGWADEERGCLASNRRRSHPTFKIDDLGFRIARTP